MRRRLRSGSSLFGFDSLWCDGSYGSDRRIGGSDLQDRLEKLDGSDRKHIQKGLEILGTLLQSAP